MTFYKIKTVGDAYGNSIAFLDGTTEASEKPASVYDCQGGRCDILTEYFASKEEADNAVEAFYTAKAESEESGSPYKAIESALCRRYDCDPDDDRGCYCNGSWLSVADVLSVIKKAIED